MKTLLKGLLILVLTGVCAGPMQADTPQPYPSFTFKRVKPPSAGSQKRITVQITPGATTKPSAPKAKETAVSRARYDWYWDHVSPALADTGPGRLEPALLALGKGPAGSAVGAPRLQALQQIAQAHGIDILKSTIGTQVSPALVLAVIGVESGGREAALSDKGATGLMQLMPDTAERFGVQDSLDPVQNIQGGVAYLDWLMTEFERDPLLVLAGYNAGEGAVRANEGVPPYAETRDYVPKVLAAWTVARGLCLTPPELITDACVLRTGAPG